MSNTTNSETSVLRDSDFLFILDFLSRYAVENCGAPATFSVGIWSLFCITPLLIWVGTLSLSFFKPEIYATLASYTLTVLTIVQLLPVFTFDEPPPVLNCGPTNSFPCGQVTLSAYGLTMFMLFDSGLHKQSGWWRIFVQLQYLLVCQSVLCIGMASPAAISAATIIGGSTACILHVSILRAANHLDSGILQKIITKLEKWFGIKMVDTVTQLVEGDIGTPDDTRQSFTNTGKKPKELTMGASELHMGYRQSNPTT